VSDLIKYTNIPRRRCQERGGGEFQRPEKPIIPQITAGDSKHGYATGRLPVDSWEMGPGATVARCCRQSSGRISSPVALYRINTRSCQSGFDTLNSI